MPGPVADQTIHWPSLSQKPQNNHSTHTILVRDGEDPHNCNADALARLFPCVRDSSPLAAAAFLCETSHMSLPLLFLLLRGSCSVCPCCLCSFCSCLLLLLLLAPGAPGSSSAPAPARPAAPAALTASAGFPLAPPSPPPSPPPPPHLSPIPPLCLRLHLNFRHQLLLLLLLLEDMLPSPLLLRLNTFHHDGEL